eukprot:7105688-Lingulodinium_polyedra.AAC.1
MGLRALPIFLAATGSGCFGTDTFNPRPGLRSIQHVKFSQNRRVNVLANVVQIAFSFRGI